MATGSSSWKQIQLKYKCIAGHTSFVTPTTKISNWRRALISNDKNIDIDSNLKDSNKFIADEIDSNIENYYHNIVHNTSNLRSYINNKKRVIQYLENNADKLKKHMAMKDLNLLRFKNVVDGMRICKLGHYYTNLVRL